MKKYFFLTLLILLCSLDSHASLPKKYNVSICALFHNQAPYLKEWIEYHRLIGVDHFYLYNNDSSDHYKEVLSPYLRRGIVTLVAWPNRLGEIQRDQAWMWALSTQIPAYENAIKCYAEKETKWLAFLDVQEFLVTGDVCALTQLLGKYEDFPAVTLSSVFFDASKIDAIPRRKLLIETIELTSPPEQNPEITITKTLFKPEETSGFLWHPYQCLFKENKIAAKLEKQTLRINYYVNRYQEGFLHIAKARDKLQLDPTLLTEQDMHELLAEGFIIEDPEKLICRYIPPLLNRMGIK